MIKKIFTIKKQLLLLFLIFNFNGHYYCSYKIYLGFDISNVWDLVSRFVKYALWDPSFSTINFNNERENYLLDNLYKKQQVDEDFVRIHNNLQKKNQGISNFLNEMFKLCFEILKEKFVKEKLYRDEKKTVYTLYFPDTIHNPIKIKLYSVFDLDEILAQRKSSLIFSQEQKLIIVNVIKEIQDNLHKIIKDPKRFDKYTTQIFLSGPPGTGKTQLAYLLSDITGLPMVVLSTSKLLLKGYESIRMIQEILEEVRISGAFLYIDEAELLFMNRESLIDLTSQSYSDDQNKSNSRTEFSEILHKLLTTFLSATGNQRHNIIISSNKIDIFDSAVRRRIKYFLYLNLPTNEVLYKIAIQYFKEYNVRFVDLTIEEAAKTIIEYNNKLMSFNKNSKALIGFSGSDIKLIILSLKELNKPIHKKNVDYYYSNKNQLISSIIDRLNIYSLFGWNINMNNSGSIILEEEKYISEFEKNERIKAQKQLEMQFKLNEKNRNEIYNVLLKNKQKTNYYMPSKNFKYFQGSNNNCNKILKNYTIAFEKYYNIDLNLQTNNFVLFSKINKNYNHILFSYNLNLVENSKIFFDKSTNINKNNLKLFNVFNESNITKNKEENKGYNSELFHTPKTKYQSKKLSNAMLDNISEIIINDYNKTSSLEEILDNYIF